MAEKHKVVISLPRVKKENRKNNVNLSLSPFQP